jgi:hypothetical protein
LKPDVPGGEELSAVIHRHLHPGGDFDAPCGGTPADAPAFFKHDNLETRLAESPGGCKPADTGADHRHIVNG